VVCRYLLDLSEVDTCHVLDLPKGTVKSRLNRALRQLRAAAAEDTAGVVEHG
jgi:DNA-directed RNA polymerase specialized sigma24 family protein